MSIKKVGDKWLLDIRPNGKYGARIRKQFDRKAEALNYEKKLSAGKIQINQPNDDRTLTQLIELWFQGHGQTLKTARATRLRLINLAHALQNPTADKLTSNLFINYRVKRLETGINPATLNRELSTIRAVISELQRMGLYEGQNPFSKIRMLKESKIELSYLTPEQIKLLLQECKTSKNPSLDYVVRLCLSTGARWSEAQNIQRSHLQNGRVQYVDTKNGSNRYVVIDRQLEDDLIKFLEKHGKFQTCYSAFREAMQRARIKTIPGQMSHILRHTFASHYIMNGGNVLSLQRVLGHSSLVMTMRYSHLAPEYQDEVKRLNPLAGGQKVDT